MPSIVKLEDINESTIIKDMNYEFAYRRVLDPDDKKTPLFSISYREIGQPWATANGLLTEQFSIAKTEDLIVEISKALNAELVAERHYRHNTSVKSMFMLKNYELDVETDSDVDKVLFNLMTDISIEEVQSKTGLAFCVINGFSGNLALQLNYGFVTSLSAAPSGSNVIKRLNVTNVFVLDEFSHRLIHDGNLDISYAQVSDVRSQCSSKIEEFKTIKLDMKFMKDFDRLFPKKFVKNFLALYDELTEEFKNLYYATFIWSSFLQDMKDLNKEINLRKFISAYVAEKKLEESKSK